MGVKLLILQAIMLLFVNDAFAQNTTNYNKSVALPGCEERCGSLVVPYPFGIGKDCSAYYSMQIDCDNSFNPAKAFLSGSDIYETRPIDNLDSLEVVNISVEAGTVHINYPISADCANTSSSPSVELDTPFTFSNTKNRFTAMGCDNLALLSSKSESDKYSVGVGGCVSRCDRSLKKDNTCFGINCCQTQFPPSLTAIEPSLSNVSSSSSRSSGCSEGPRYAFIVDQTWFGKLKDIYSVQTMETVPAVVNWRTYGQHCQSFVGDEPFPSGTLCGVNATCTNQSLCSCKQGYQGNPYLRDGCQDINECTSKPGSSLKRHRCQHSCTNTPGNYICSCMLVLISNMLFILANKSFNIFASCLFSMFVMTES